jgi:hypothetical protein
MAYWPERGDETIALGAPTNVAPGFLNRAELASRYAEASGRRLTPSGCVERFELLVLNLRRSR